MNCFQREIILSPRRRGLHLITNDVVSQIPEIRRLSIGTLHLFICHTSASITLNENASADVRSDMEAHFERMVPEKGSYYDHTIEGPDDMPAHIKASLFGSSIIFPITSGKPNLGTWQGIYLCEHRNHGGARRLIATLWGVSIP